MLSPYTAFPATTASSSSEVDLALVTALLALVLFKQLVTGVRSRRASRLNRILLIPIPALLMVFLAEALSRGLAELGL